jgi:hypothetical protein
MLSGTFFGPVALLYYLCELLLAGLTVFIAWRGRRRPRTRARLRRTFCLLSLALLLWLLTLFLEVRTALPAVQLWLGRANFAAVLFAATLALRFVREVPLPAAARLPPGAFWLLVATGLLGVLTLATPWIDAAERVEAGRAITRYGPLFPAYLAHVLGCLVAALVLAFQGWRRADDPRVRRQLALIGLGMLATGSDAFLTNALLPYGWGEFRFCDVGTLSTLLFVLAIAYATFLHGLFDLRVLLRRTLVYGLLLAFVLGTFSSTVFVISEYLTDSTGKLTQFAVLFIAFSLDPLRRFLEEKTDHLLFGKHGSQRARQKRRPSEKGERAG